MASKNPIKGYIACPTHGCGEVCTIHAVGEHKILEGGDPPKNKRRLGQLYTICPSLQNQPKRRQTVSRLVNKPHGFQSRKSHYWLYVQW